MAKFLGDEEKSVQANENDTMLKNMAMSIKLVDKTTGEEFNLENEEVTSIRFKERKGVLFMRLKGKNGIVLSIPKSKLPPFISIVEEKRAVW
jgi:hypothetical protein